MGAKYIFRLDDVCENMNWKNYSRVKEIFLNYGIKPIIGVIPNNQDTSFLKYPHCKFDFWQEVKDLQSNRGWSIALHGYSHVYETEKSGIFQINPRSEFAGLGKNQQYEKIRRGIEIFREKDLRIDAFMAPAHSLDEVTIECLKENKIDTITDGYALYPYYEFGMLFVPQLTSKPKRMPWGIWTWCLHTNNMSKRSIDYLEIFIKNNVKDIISFNDSKSFVKENMFFKMQNFFLRNSIMMLRELRSKRGKL